MFLEDLKKIKDNELLTRFSLIVQKEREAIASVVLYLSEIARRRLYLEEAYSSLFSFVTQKFHYSEGAAYRRIQASKVSQLYPGVLGLLSEGKVSLMTLSLIEPHLTKENAEGWIKKVIGKSKREVESLLSGLSLKKESHRDIIRRLPAPMMGVERPEKLQTPLKVSGSFSGLASRESESAQNYTITGESSEMSSVKGVRRIKIEFVAKEELAEKVERAKEVLRHKFPEGKFEDIFSQALDDLLEKRDPERKRERANRRKMRVSHEGERGNTMTKRAEGGKENSKDKDMEKIEGLKKESGEGRKALTRYIPEEVKRVVFERDRGRCSYESRDGKRCGERNFIQTDHLQPFALGGESTEENLRLLCAQHNRWRSEKTFGKSG